MAEIRVVDVRDEASFGLVPPCADERFDHRTCDYWEDADRGSKLHRPGWLTADSPPPVSRPALVDNPFAAPAAGPAFNPFLDADDEPDDADNPFAPTSSIERPVRSGIPRKLALLDRGRGVFGSYAKVLLADDEAVAYCQFGPLSAYPRATRLRDLYPQLPSAPLPAVITCIATTAEARRRGWAKRLVDEVCRDLAGRGFAAVEAYPDLTRDEDETSAGRPIFWHTVGFATAVDDERFPVMRRELD
ncbi:MAG TPA: GNAT family N-acetyltransferase [Candidatus Limnocylindrales bacterium]|nr:GNAT family N-acetyltransferase [Candidatus Limnocylindrales bacterium]